MTTRTSTPTLGIIALAWIAGCGEGTTVEPPSSPIVPHIAALSTYEAGIGTLVDIYGTNFPPLDVGFANVLFEGVFVHEDGTSENVRFEAPTRRIDGSTLRWSSFGPFYNPFSPASAEMGTFHGSVGIVTLQNDGTRIDDPNPTDITFEVGPSLIVTEFQPVTAECTGGVVRAIGGAAYRIGVETVGFEPEVITYTMSAPALRMPPISVRHIVTSRSDLVGERGDFVMPPVPDDFAAYGAIVTVQARDASGKTRQNAFGVTVHRPIEVFYNGNVTVAEVMAPTPVSGCIPGGINGRNVTYSESQSETRSRNYAVNWNESWLSAHTVAAGSSETVGLSERNGVGFSTTDGQSFNWSLGNEVSGSFGLSELVSIGVDASSSQGGDTSRSVNNTQSRETGINASTTTTETEQFSQSMGGQQGESFSWQVSSTQSIGTSFSAQVIPASFGVFYRQTARMLRRAAVVAYNQCGYAQVVGDVDFSDWQWSPDLALDDQCPPLPQSNLPPAECFVPPCAGQ